MSEVMVVASKVKKMVKEMGMRTGGDAIEKLSEVVVGKIKTAIDKAKAAGRKTIQAIDIE